MAQGAKSAGFEVEVACPNNGKSFEDIERLGFKCHEIDLNRGGLNPIKDMIKMIYLYKLLKRLKPDILQCVSVKPSIYGAITGQISGLKKIYCLINGLGYAFEKSDFKSSLVNKIVKILYRIALYPSSIKVIFQNPDDQNDFIREGLVEARKTHLIKGSGVNMQIFKPSDFSKNERPIVLFAGRLLWSKGLGTLIKAAQVLQNKNISFSLIIVGNPDFKNPQSISEDFLKNAENENLIQLMGYQQDMYQFYKMADIVVLPTEYREGLPLTLLEAASCGRSLIATDVPGCREIVRNGVNGFLIPPRDVNSLADAMEKLILSEDMRHKFGKASTEIVKNEFSSEIIQNKLNSLYKST
jgi:glycosyltransferase involved in cell wall biosynthesis